MRPFVFATSASIVASILCGLSTFASAQNYPATQYGGFSGGDFATSVPNPEAPSFQQNDQYRSMSPDSWQSPRTSTDEILINGANEISQVHPGYQSNDFAMPSLDRQQKSIPPSPTQASSKFDFASFSKSKNGDDHLPDSWRQESPTVPQNIRQPDAGSAVTGSRYPLSGNTNANPGGPFSTPSANAFNGYQASIIQEPGQTNSANTNTWVDENISQQLKSAFNNPTVPMNESFGSTFSHPSIEPMQQGVHPIQNFRPDLGHRDVTPTVRNWGTPDNGQKFEFDEKKKEYPPMREIIATGKFFGSGTMLYLKPSFQGNSAIFESVTGNSSTFDFDYEAAPQFQVGFESKYGPGIELNYWQFDEASTPATFTSDGANIGTTSVWMMGGNQWSRLSAANAGESLSATHDLDIETFGASFFKEVKLPISRINGKFGFQYVSIAHQMNATLADAGGAEIGNLNSRSDLRAYGPKFTMEYFRPVGHTKFEFLTQIGGSVMFGKQDQFVENSTSGQLSRLGADEFVSTVDFMSGVQYRKMISENRHYFARAGYQFQTWLNGGTAVLPQDNFGLRGFSFTVGYNR